MWPCQTLTTTTLADGSWSVDAEVIIAEGSFTVEASVSDVAGNSASTSATGLIDLTAPTISVDPLSDSADVTPLISGVANGVATGTLVNLEITDSAGNVQTATAIVQADGSWSVEPSVAIAEGEFPSFSKENLCLFKDRGSNLLLTSGYISFY